MIGMIVDNRSFQQAFFNKCIFQKSKTGENCPRFRSVLLNELEDLRKSLGKRHQMDIFVEKRRI